MSQTFWVHENYWNFKNWAEFKFLNQNHLSQLMWEQNEICSSYSKPLLTENVLLHYGFQNDGTSSSPLIKKMRSEGMLHFNAFAFSSKTFGFLWDTKHICLLARLLHLLTHLLHSSKKLCSLAQLLCSPQETLHWSPVQLYLRWEKRLVALFHYFQKSMQSFFEEHNISVTKCKSFAKEGTSFVGTCKYIEIL